MKEKLTDLSRIMYVCTDCAEAVPENCGHFDRKNLAVMPDGRWLCEFCYDALPPLPNFRRRRQFAKMSHPPLYRAALAEGKQKT